MLENKIYAIGGLCGLEEEIGRCPQDFVYVIALDEWKQIDPFPGAASIHMSAFVLDGRAYVGGGFKSLLRIGDEYFSYGHFPVDPSNEFYEYNPKTNTWRRLADFPGIARGGSFHFSLNSYGYLGCGAISLFDKFLKDFWRYDPIRDEWTQLADFPGGRRFGATATTLKNMGVAGLGVRIQESEPETVVRDTEHFFRVDKDVDLWLYDPNLK